MAFTCSMLGKYYSKFPAQHFEELYSLKHRLSSSLQRPGSNSGPCHWWYTIWQWLFRLRWSQCPSGVSGNADSLRNPAPTPVHPRQRSAHGGQNLCGELREKNWKETGGNIDAWDGIAAWQADATSVELQWDLCEESVKLRRNNDLPSH